MKLSLTKEEFIAAAKAANLITVSTELTMDLDTPVSIYYKLVGEKKGYIMESVDTTQQQFGRYSFIGGEPFVRVQVFADKLLINENGLMKSITGAPHDTMKAYAAHFTPAVTAEETLPLVHGGLAGYFTYETAATFDRVRGVEIGAEELLGQFMMCRYLVVYDALKNSAHLHYLADVREGDDAGELYDAVTERLAAMRARLAAPFTPLAAAESRRKEPVDFMARYGKAPASFLHTIDTIKEHIYAGDIFQAVPSFRFREKITRPAFLFYRRLRQVNPSPYMFYYNFGEVKLVGASPEMLIKVSSSTVYTYPIAGTRKRGKTDEEDALLALDLRSDEKECAEHAMLVDLARNDLGRISVP
ncbi:chorismate-binding protein, partial [uncultured Selenomonas sp.]|uniref:chorismate-binding protein n=1 Tax=uncultured Selenomonas sp. TaxID=159275 RepID=UPI0028ED3C4F